MSKEQAQIDLFEKQLKKEFKLKNLGQIENYLGIQIQKKDNGYILNQIEDRGNANKIQDAGLQ